MRNTATRQLDQRLMTRSTRNAIRNVAGSDVQHGALHGVCCGSPCETLHLALHIRRAKSPIRSDVSRLLQIRGSGTPLHQEVPVK